MVENAEVTVHALPAIVVKRSDITFAGVGSSELSTIEPNLLKRLLKERYGDRHFCPPVPFYIENESTHGWVCPECGKILSWG